MAEGEQPVKDGKQWLDEKRKVCGAISSEEKRECTSTVGKGEGKDRDEIVVRPSLNLEWVISVVPNLDMSREAI